MGKVNSMSLLLHHKELEKDAGVVAWSPFFISKLLDSLLGLDIG